MNIVTKVEKFMTKYITFREESNSLPLALWAIATHTWPTFDYFPYLLITKPVKRCGGTRTLEITAMVAAYSEQYSADSAASMFRDLWQKEDKPSMFIDEAEKLNKEDHPAREFLNKGYKRGQFITKVYGNKTVKIDAFGPKCFALIGGVYDTLKDRSIVVILRRRTPIEAMAEDNKAYRSKDVEEEARPIRAEVSRIVEESQVEIEDMYSKMKRLSFLNDRDEEIWSSIFAVASVLCPERMEELTRVAVDMAREKQIDLGKPSKDAEIQANKEEDGVFLLRDMLTLTQGKKYILSRDVIEQLYAITTAPWRKYNGTGLDTHDVARLLEPLHVESQTIRIANPKNVKPGTVTTQKGYKREHLEAAWKLAGTKAQTR